MILSKLKQTLLGATIVISSLVMQVNAQSSSPRRITVDPSSTTNSGTSFSTIKMAVDSSRDRDTILVKEGTYKEKIIVGGSKRLVFGSEFLLDGVKTHISNTIISGAGITQSSQNDVLFGAFGNTYDSTYFRFVGFTIDSAAKYGMEVRGGLVTDCIFKNSGSATTVPFYFQGTYLRNITVHNNIGTAIIAFNGVGAQNTNAPYAVIENGLFYNNKGVSTNQNERGPYGQNLGGVIWYNGDLKAKLLNSIFYNNSGDHLLIMGGSNRYDTIDVYNNVFYKNKTRTAFFRTWEGDYGRNNLTSRWYNNIIDNNYTQATQPNASEFAWGGGSGNTKPFNYIFKNNIFSETLNTSTQTGFTTGFTFSYDTASHIIGSVQFEDTAALNFALKNSSAGIGAGIASLVPTKDFNGNSRPNPAGTSVDIGAVESQLSYPIPQIVNLQNAVSSSKNAVKVFYSVPSRPAGDSIILYRGLSTDTTNLLTLPKDSAVFAAGTQVLFIDTNAIATNTRYYYGIKTLFANKSKSALSNVANITTPASASIVATPTALVLTSSGRSGVALTWSSTTKYSAGGTTPTNTSVSAATWYVKNTGLDTRDGSSEANAFKTLTYALTKSIKGDVIILLPGTYNEKVKVPIGITIASKYYLDATDTASIRSTIISGANLTGNIFTYANNNAPGNNRNRYIGLHFKNATGTTKFFNNQWGGPSSITIDRSIFSNNGNQTIATDPNGNYEDAIRYSNFGDSTIITNTTFENNFGKIRLEGNNFTIRHNRFANNNLNVTKPNNNWIRLGVIDGWVNGKTLITDNIFINNGTKEILNNGNNNRQNYVLMIGGNDTLSVTNNTFYGNLVPAISVDNQNPTTYLVNNLFYKNEVDFYVVPWGNQFGDMFVENNYFKNDLSKSNIFDKLTVTYSNNLILDDPSIEDTVTLKLAPSSQLINAGKNQYWKNNTRTVSSTDIEVEKTNEWFYQWLRSI